MKRNFGVGIIMVITSLSSLAQTDEQLMIIELAAGASCVEELSEYELERIFQLLEDPVRINVEGPDKLVEAGLLTRYQAASLADYRVRHGDVLSFKELSLVDGFTSSLADLLKPFISLDSFRGTEPPSANSMKYDAVIRSSARKDASGRDYSYSAKLRVRYGESLSGNVSFSRNYGVSTASPKIRSFNVSGSFPAIGLDVFLGDFNARFGQGLVLWNGMSMGGVSSPSSMRRNASGLSSTWSFTGSSALTGAAVRWNLGNFAVSAAVALPGIKNSGWNGECLPMLNLAWCGRYGQVALTHIADMAGMTAGNTHIPEMKTSADAQMCIKGVNIYSEAAYDWVSGTFAALAGSDWGAAEDCRLGIHMRYYPAQYSSTWSSAVRSSTKCSNEYGISFSGESRKCLFSLDAVYHPVPKVKDASSSMQIKAQVRWMPSVGEILNLDFRIVERWRSWGEAFRTDFRADADLNFGRLAFSTRINVLKCKDYGLLMYLEESWKNGNLSLHVRQGAFRIDDWDDRIYVYERDAPGSFNVPAFYGRGVWASLYAGWRFWSRGRMYLRLFYVTYPFMKPENEKPGKAELRFQFVFSL